MGAEKVGSGERHCSIYFSPLSNNIYNLW